MWGQVRTGCGVVPHSAAIRATAARPLPVGDQAEAYRTAGQGRLSLARVTPRRHGLWVPQLAREQGAIDSAAATQPADSVEEPIQPTAPPSPPADPAGLDLPVDVPELDGKKTSEDE